MGTMLLLFILFYDQSTSNQKSCRINFKKESFDWKLKGLVPFLVVKSDRRAANPPPSYATQFPKHIQSKFWESHFVQRCWKVANLYLRMTTPPPKSLRARVVSYALEAYKVYTKRVIVKNFGMGSFDYKSNVLVPFSRFRVIEGWTPPPQHLGIFSKCAW